MARKRTLHKPLRFKVSFVFEEFSEHTPREAEETAHKSDKSVSMSPTEFTGMISPLRKFFTLTVRMRDVATPSPNTFFAFTTT